MLDLDLEITPDLVATVVRELSESDVMRPLGSHPPTIAKLRDPHHALARALASGMKDVEASALTGYSQTRICILKNDPTFQGLLAHYRENVDAAYLALHERMANFAGALLAEIQERVEDSGGTLPVDQLHSLFRTMTDKIIPKPGKRGPLDEDATSVPLTMDLAKLDSDERAQIREMIERRMLPAPEA